MHRLGRGLHMWCMAPGKHVSICHRHLHGAGCSLGAPCQGCLLMLMLILSTVAVQATCYRMKTGKILHSRSLVPWSAMSQVQSHPVQETVQQSTGGDEPVSCVWNLSGGASVLTSVG